MEESLDVTPQRLQAPWPTPPRLLRPLRRSFERDSTPVSASTPVGIRSYFGRHCMLGTQVPEYVNSSSFQSFRISTQYAR